MRDRGNSEIFGQEELERRMLHGLFCEWERAIWILPSSHREKMRPPLFCLRDMRERWGVWDGKKREISLSRNLVMNHSWGSVLEVLFHEMAHQLAEEVLGGRNEPPHGPIFHQACHLLRANPRASDHYKTLDQRVLQESSDSQDRILLRVRKLLALAESPNQHEAEAAMAKAHGLIAKYNLDLLKREERRDFISLYVGRPALRHFGEDYSLAHLLQDFYFVQGIWVPAYVLEKRKMGRVLEISGTIPNVRLASYIHDFVRRFIHSQWIEYNDGKGLNRYRQTDFAVGIIEGFRSRLESDQKKEGDVGKTSALVKRQDPLLSQYLAYRHPHTVMFRTGGSKQDMGVRKDGIRVGKSLVIAKGITDRAGNRGFLLPS